MREKKLVSTFSAIAVVITGSLILLLLISSRADLGVQTRVWTTAAVSVVSLLSLFWAFTRIRREIVSREQAAASLQEQCARVEAKLRETQERFRAVSDNARAAFGILVGTKLVYANRYFAELTGYSVEEIVGMDFRQMTHPSCHQLMMDRARQRLAGEPAPSHYEFLAVTKSGEEKWIDFSPAVTLLEGKPVIIGTGFDVTERKRAEDALKESEEKFRLLAESSKVLICIFRDRRVLYANPYLLEVSGYTQEELLSLDFFELIPVEDRARILDRALRRQQGEVLAAPSSEFRLLDKSGQAHWVQFWGAHIQYQGSGAVLATGIDISERKRAEAALHESQERFRIVAENAQAAFGIVQGRQFVYANPYLAKMSGYSKEELLSLDISLLVHPDSRDMVLDYARRRQLGEPVPTNYEFAMLTKDGQKRWLDLSVGRTEYQGKPAIVGTGYDITTRRAAEQALAENRARLAGIIDSAMDAIVTVDEAQNIVLFNPAAERMFRCRTEEVLGSSLDRFIPERFRITHREHIRDFARTGSTARAMGHLRPLAALRADGEEFPIEASISQVEVQNRKLFSVILRDITERQRAEQALRESQAKVRLQAAALEAAASAVALSRTDAQGTIVWVNRAFTELTGYSAEEAIGQSHRLLKSGVQDEAFYRELWRTINRGDVWHGELVNRRKDGTLYEEEMRITPIRDEGGRITHFVAIKNDITARKRATEELAAAKQSAEEASQAKDHFLAVLSHELRTPLTPALGIAELLASDSRLEQDVQQDLEMIRRNVELEARLIDDLLDLTRIARGKVELVKRLLPLCEIIQRAVEVCEADIEARQLHFTVEMGPGAPYLVEADPARLQQVFWNLLKNSIKFTPPGGTVSVRCDSAGGHVVAEVTDSGVGIEPEAMGKIFNAFEQASTSITRQFGGLGLGLAISKALVDMHGGKIEAHSDGHGKGATFRLTLPLARAARPAHGPPVSPVPRTEPSARPMNVLLVEDHGDTARILARLLTRRGYRVQTAGDVAIALQLADRQRFDLLVSDLGLPDRSGVELVRELRAKGQTLPAIALSGYGQEEDVQRSREAGFNAHLTKPVDFQQFYRAIAVASGEANG